MQDPGKRSAGRAPASRVRHRQLGGLEAELAAVDLEAIDQDRREAGDRALFDPSREAALARRYESEAGRGFFRALEEFRRVEAEAAERAKPAEEPAAEEAPSPIPSRPVARLGSPGREPRRPRATRDRPSKRRPGPGRGDPGRRGPLRRSTSHED